MQDILHRGALIAIGIGAMLGASPGHAAEIVFVASPGIRLGQVLHIDAPSMAGQAMPGERTPARNTQSLVLNCEKIEQAQRGLQDALRNGPRYTPILPVLPGTGLSGSTPSADALYQIARNEENVNGLSKRFGCLAR